MKDGHIICGRLFLVCLGDFYPGIVFKRFPIRMKPILKSDNLFCWLCYYLKQNLLPEKIIERVASGVDFRDHFV